MPTNEEINIVLKLIDQASAQLKGTIGEAGKEAEDLKKKSDKASKSLTDGFKEAGKQLRDFRRAAFAATATIGIIIATTKEWAKHNEETKHAYDSLEISIKEITALIGSLFAPTIIALADLLKSSLQGIKSFFEIIQNLWTGLFKSISYGVQFIISFIAAMKEGVGITEAYKIATKDASKAVEEMGNKFKATFTDNIPQTEEAKRKLEEYANRQKDIELLFRSGQISAQEYFNSILGLQNQAIEQNTIIADQAREYIALAQEVSNTELLNFQTRLQGQMDLFTTYKEMYMQGHADMFAFGNMLANQFHTNMSDALSSIIMGEKKASEAFKEFGMAMVKAVVDYVVQQAIAFAISQMMKGVILSTTTALATALALAWAPAAAMASLATVGQNAEAAISGMAITTATAYALAAPKAMATGGEGIVNRPTLFLAGEAGAEYYNFTPLRKGGGGSYIQINLTAVISNRLDIVSVAEEIGYEIDKQLRYARSY